MQAHQFNAWIHRVSCCVWLQVEALYRDLEQQYQQQQQQVLQEQHGDVQSTGNHTRDGDITLDSDTSSSFDPDGI